ncbi:MAG: hypothetical protein QW390_02690 [Candidatus Bathyarchaeia archaeon]
MGDRYAASPRYLTPVMLSLIFTGCLSLIIKVQKISVEPITIFPETPSGATLNSSLFIIPIAVAATVIYVLVRLGLHRLVTGIIKATLILAVFVIFLWYGALVYPDNVARDILDPSNLLIAGFSTTALALMMYRGGSALQVIALTLVSSFTGTFLGASIPLLTAFVLLAGLSAYDVISVFRGPIGKIAEKTELEKLMGAVVNYKGLTIGMGDLVFYSMLGSGSMLNLGYGSFLGSAAGVVAGAYGTFKMLEKREMFPGLPLPLVSGMALALLAWIGSSL